MVKNEIVILVCAFLAMSCSPQMQWQKFDINAQKTGVSASSADNATESIGVVSETQYIAPNGAEFSNTSCTYAVAKEMLDAQAVMAKVKEVVAQSDVEIIREGKLHPLAYWSVDRLHQYATQLLGRKIDCALLNAGGIRADLPKGDILLDDILSMFPFKNYLCLVVLKGEDLRALVESMLVGKGMQPMSGVQIVIEDNKLVSFKIGDRDVEDNQLYNLVTLDFMLDGGDLIYAAKNAKELIITNCLMKDCILSCVRDYAQRGEAIHCVSDDRIIVR